MNISRVLKVMSCTIGMMSIASSTVLASQGFVDGEVVNIRQEAKIGSTVLGKVQRGQVFEVLDVTEDWFKIVYNDKEAFISADYFEIETADAFVTANSVNLRDLPCTSEGQVIQQLAEGLPVLVTGKVDDWYQVNYSGKEGYIIKDYLVGNLIQDVPNVDIEVPEINVNVLPGTYGVVNAEAGLKLRAIDSVDGEVVATLPNDTNFAIEYIGEEWIKAVTDGGKVGYVNVEYVKLVDGIRPVQPTNTLGHEVIEFAKQFIGTPYSWGGTDLNNGVDCSGFVFSVMKNFGVDLNRTSYDMASNGTEVSKSELQPGDLVFFNGGSGGINHVGLALGDDLYIHASSSSAQSVVISDLNSSYNIKSYVTARRVLH